MLPGPRKISIVSILYMRQPSNSCILGGPFLNKCPESAETIFDALHSSLVSPEERIVEQLQAAGMMCLLRV